MSIILQFFQIRFLDWFLIPCRGGWVHGRSSHNHSSSTTQRVPWNQEVHQENKYRRGSSIRLQLSPSRSNYTSVFSSVSFTFSISSHVCHCLQWNWQTILISISFLIFLLVCKFIVSLQTIHCCLSSIYVFLFWSDLLIQTGQEEQETVLDSGRRAVAISYYFHILCLHNPSRQERC